VHPVIRKKIYYKVTKRYNVIVEIPLLNINNIQIYFYLKNIITIMSSSFERNKRIVMRNKKNTVPIKDLKRSQIKNSERISISSYIIYNNCREDLIIQERNINKALINGG
jgi:dephospho-CoA kinase